MAIYAIHNQEPKFIFIINYKVMFSSLYEILPAYFPTVQFYHKNQVKQFKFSSFSKYAIVRNPYNRVVSTFYDKCQQSPMDNLNKEKAQLQYCQQQILIAINALRKKNYKIVSPATQFASAENITDRAILNENFEILKSISFEEYVQCLYKIFKEKNVDGHFQNQYKAFNLPNQNAFYFPLKVFKNTKIIKLEKLNSDWNTICNQLGKNMVLQKSNNTDHLRPTARTFFTKETQETVANLYKIDFKKFNYSLEI